MRVLGFGAYARRDMLDMTMQCLQVCWERSKIACFILLWLVFVYREGILGLTLQLHLGWSSYTHSITGVAAKLVGTSSHLGPAVITGLSRERFESVSQHYGHGLGLPCASCFQASLTSTSPDTKISPNCDPLVWKPHGG